MEQVRQAEKAEVDEQRRAIGIALVAIAAAVTPAAPAPGPDPARPPKPGPEPAPTPDPDIGKILTRTLNLERAVTFQALHAIYTPYERFQRLLVLKSARERVQILGVNLGSGQGGRRALSGTEYTLLCDGKPVATQQAPAGAASLDFMVDTTQIEHGWRLFDIDCRGSGESAQVLPVFVMRKAVTEQPPFMWTIRAEFERAVRGQPNVMAAAKVPARFAPRAVPITTKRRYANVPVIERKLLHCEMLVPVKFGDMYRPNVNRDGIMSTFDCQAYTWSQFHGPYPLVALLDGPRGVGTVSALTHVMTSEAVINGVQRRSVYATDPWRVVRISEDGTISTLAGYRSKGNMLRHWSDAEKMPRDEFGKHAVELVGDWSAVPGDRRGFHELWGLAWDTRTVTVDPKLPLIPNDTAGGELQQQHPDPVLFAADTQRNRICRIQFDHASHATPAKVTEFITGLLDPWDVVYADGLLFVSERKSHRICAYDATTGARVRVVVQGQPLATVDVNREVITPNVPAAQAAACVAPEGLAFQDGWLYFGSKAQAQIRRVRPDGSELEVVRPVEITGNSKFVKLALSDGTFGPRGASLTWTWSNADGGGPEVWSPAPGSKKLTDTIWWGMAQGGTGDWTLRSGYATAGCASHGQLLNSNMLEGLSRVTASQSGDVAETPAVATGRQQYMGRFLHLVHGIDGFGYYGLPLPWGETPEIDAYLTFCGHQRPA